MYKIIYIETAKEDILEITKYIAYELSNQVAAIRLANKIVSSIERLKEQPYMCPTVKTIFELNSEYRKLLVENYIVFYSVDEKRKIITIARVIYARRNYIN